MEIQKCDGFSTVVVATALSSTGYATAAGDDWQKERLLGTDTGFQGVIIMKRILFNTAMALIVASPISYAEGFMTKEQRQATFCGKTFDGKNLINGATFKIHIDPECKTNTIHFLTGKKAGKIEERKIISMSDEGELCHTSNRDYCNKMKDMGDGTYKGTGTSGRWKDKEYVKLSNIVDGNQL